MPDNTENTELKELQQDIEEMQKYPIKLSWKNTWIVLTTLITVIGSAFGVGMKVQYEGDRILQYDIEQSCKQKLAGKEDIIIETNRKLKEISEDNIYLQNRYNIMKERLEKCMKYNPVFNALDSENN